MGFGKWHKGDRVLTGEDSVRIWWEGWRTRDEVSSGLEVGHCE